MAKEQEAVQDLVDPEKLNAWTARRGFGGAKADYEDGRTNTAKRAPDYSPRF